MLSDIEYGFTFDDFTLVPQYSTIKSRKEPDVSVQIKDKNYSIPIIASPMNTICECSMALDMAYLGGESVIHRYMTIEDQVDHFKRAYKHHPFNASPYCAIGATGDYLERAKELYRNDVRHFCIDIANGHSEICTNAVRKLRSEFTDSVTIMAGNVCTYIGAAGLGCAGVDLIRVGIGPGSACLTRCVTGHGVPQLTALEDCVKIKDLNSCRHVAIISDGGIRTSGDIVKCLAMGADMVMIGGLLAGTSSTPGQLFHDEEGRPYKTYAGMASAKGREGWFNRENTSFVPEGDAFRVPYRGETKKVIEDLVNGLKVGMSYCGSYDLKELHERAKWMRVTDNGRKEGTSNSKMFRSK